MKKRTATIFFSNLINNSIQVLDKKSKYNVKTLNTVIGNIQTGGQEFVTKFLESGNILHISNIFKEFESLK
jgi:hypothetical protein